MITRITRGSLRPKGMLGLSISRNVGEKGVEVAVTVWSDLESIAAVIGPDRREAAWLPGLADHIVDSRTELLETVVSTFEDPAAD